MTSIKINNLILGIAIIALGFAALMVFGSSLGFWEPIVGFGLSRQYNNYLGMLVVVISVSRFAYLYQSKNRGLFKLFISFFLGGVILCPAIISFIVTPMRYPAIHDITTNIDNPPTFTFLDDNRKGAKNSLVYGGKKVSEQQLKSYPQIQAITTDSSITDAYKEAVIVAKSMGWNIVKEDLQDYHFEATARTPFFNFVDDIVIEISHIGNGSRIDIRSVSRIGRGDRGVNAKRIMNYIKEFEQ